MTTDFSLRLATILERATPFCFGIDPSESLLMTWGLSVDPQGLRDFCNIALRVALKHVAVIKPQVAFFEAFGPEGLAVLRDLIAEARQEGLIVIADAKRGDIGHSSLAYGKAWLGSGSAFNCDAITVSPYLGFGALKPLIEHAETSGCGVFVVVRSSNPEGRALQAALIDGMSVADTLADEIQQHNRERSPAGLGAVGAVLGATIDKDAHRTAGRMPLSHFLLPGVGTQGATFEDVARRFSGALTRIIPSASRAILERGPSVAELEAGLSEFSQAARRIRRSTVHA